MKEEGARGTPVLLPKDSGSRTSGGLKKRRKWGKREGCFERLRQGSNSGNMSFIVNSKRKTRLGGDWGHIIKARGKVI